MKKRIKNNLLLITFLICIFGFVTNTKAKTYTVSIGVVDSLGEKIIDGNWYASGTTYWYFNGGSDKVYCVTPGGNAPDPGDTFKEINLGSNQAAFDYICSKVENLTDQQRGAILKLAAIKTKISSSTGDSKAYDKFFTDSNTKFVGTDPDDATVRTWLNEMSSATSSTSNVSASKSGNTVTLTSNKVKVNLSIDNGYSIKVDGVDNGSNVELTPSSEKTYKITVVAPSGSTSSSATLSIKYDQSSAGTSTATATLYKISGSTSGVQKGISCDYSNASNNCDTGFTLNGTVCEKSITVSENKTKKDCDDTEIEEKHGSTGSEICDLDGNTVVKVTENKYTTDPTEDDLDCIAENSTKATKVMYGSSNDYCEVYCTENITLTLPGPDATNDTQNSAGSNKNLYINAGSYFTIDGDKKETNEVTCYAVLDYNKYQGTIYSYRKAIVDAYNAYALELATKSASSEVTDSTTNITTCELTGTKTYSKLTIDTSNGTISKTTGTVTTADCTITDSSINNLKSALSSAVSTANTGITTAKDKWDECFTSFDMSKVVTALSTNCDTEISFDYGDSECSIYELEGTTTVTSGPTTPTAKLANGYVNVGICDYSSLISGGTSNCNQNDSHEFAKYISSTVTLTTTYEFKNDFTINLETGEVSCDAKTGSEYSDVYQGFPVKTSAIQGKYAYNYTYEGIGHDLESGTCTTGRFDKKINKNSFGCYFDVNSCKECDIICLGDNCNGEYEECDTECQTTCVGGGCIVDGNGGFLAVYKTISLNNEFAYNAMSQDKTTMVALAYSGISSTKSTSGNFSNWDTTKGEDTSDKILEDGETIYSDEPEYSITLTPSDIADIKEYNENEASYSKAELECINYNNYGICTSSFIHDKFKDLFKINTSSVAGYETKEYNGVKFASYDLTKTDEFVGPAWK